MATYLIGDTEHELPTLKDAEELAYNIAQFNANCNGDNVVIPPIKHVKFMAKTLFGNGQLLDTKREAEEDAEAAYHFANTCCNTTYSPDFTIEKIYI